jgi:hypothetical protein
LEGVRNEAQALYNCGVALDTMELPLAQLLRDIEQRIAYYRMNQWPSIDRCIASLLHCFISLLLYCFIACWVGDGWV